MRAFLALILAWVGGTSTAAAENLFEWRVGVAYASGLGDVTDLYEANLREEGLDAEVDLKFPLGLAVGVTYDWASGMRADLTLGPTFFIEGDIDHFEVPLGATLGYNFARGADVSPYVRGGVVHHFASGDFYSSSTPGPLVAVGLDFVRFTIEVAADLSEVEFDEITCVSPGVECTQSKEELNTYDVVASVFWRFR